MNAEHRGIANTTSRNDMAREALASSTLSRPQAQLEEDQKHEMAGRAGQNAAMDAAEKYAKKILKLKQYNNSDKEEIINRAIAVGKAAGYAAGARQDNEDEGARVGRNAGISNVAKMLADTLHVSAQELLKDANTDILAMSKETKSGEDIAEDQKQEKRAMRRKKKPRKKWRQRLKKQKKRRKMAVEDAEAEKDMTPAQLKHKKEQDKKAEEAEEALEESKAEQAKAIDEGASPAEVTAQAVKDAKEAGKAEGKKEAINAESAADQEKKALGVGLNEEKDGEETADADKSDDSNEDKDEKEQGDDDDSQKGDSSDNGGEDNASDDK